MTSEAFEATVGMLTATNLAGEASIGERRRAIDGLELLLGSADGTTVEDVDAGGVPARWVRPAASADVPAPAPAVLWLHGGGYNIGSPGSHTPAASRLAAALGAPVLVPDYRLAPEHPHPGAIEDAVTAWRWLVDGGADPGRTAVVGDSAGGGLAIALAMRLRDEGAPVPAALGLLCPWVDLTGADPVDDARAAADVVLDVGLLAGWAATYAGGTPLDDHTLSPLRAPLQGLPPMLIHAGGRDILCDQALRLADVARSAGVAVDLEVADDMIHAWHLFAGAFPEAEASLGELAAWLTPRLAPAPRGAN